MRRERDALLRIMLPILEDSKRVVAVGGIVRVLNGSEIVGGQLRRVRLPNKSIEAIQVIEYLRTFQPTFNLIKTKLSTGKLLVEGKTWPGKLPPKEEEAPENLSLMRRTSRRIHAIWRIRTIRLCHNDRLTR